MSQTLRINIALKIISKNKILKHISAEIKKKKLDTSKKIFNVLFI